MTQFIGLEGLPEVITDPRALRRAYLEEFGAFLKSVKSGCRQHMVDYIEMRTDQPLDLALSSYLAGRAIHVN